MVAVAGLSGSGKTTLAHRIIQSIDTPWTVVLSLDNFYKPLTLEERKIAKTGDYNFDCPDALDMDLLYESLSQIRAGKRTRIPMYSFKEHDRIKDRTLSIYGANVVVVEGILALADERLLDLFDCTVFVDASLDVCLARRLLRDTVQRGRDVQDALRQWEKFVCPSASAYVLPQRAHVDIVIPDGVNNKQATEMLLAHIRRQLSVKSKNHVERLRLLGMSTKFDLDRLHLLPLNNQLKVIKTILINKSTPISDFIFYFDRLASLLITHALDYTQYTAGPTTITTPTNSVVKPSNCIYNSKPICGVTIVRSGDTFIRALRRTLPSPLIGKLLIQTDSTTGEPQLHTEKLPHDKETQVLLFDSQILSGVGVVMAIQVLLDHGWKQSDIIVVAVTCTRRALRVIFNAYKEIQVVAAIVSLGEAIGYEENDDSTVDCSATFSERVYDSDNGDDDWWMRNRFIDERYYGTS